MESVDSLIIITMDKCMKGWHAHDKTIDKNNRVTGMGCSAATRPCKKREMSCPLEEVAPPGVVCGPVA